MRHLATAAEHLGQARGLPAVLDAACDAFEAILQVIGDYEDATATVCVPFLLAATHAANGRDAVLFAPSLPPRARHPPRATQEQERGSVAGISAATAGVSRLLAARLAHAAALAAGADRGACHDAARHATQIHGLLTGHGP